MTHLTSGRILASMATLQMEASRYAKHRGHVLDLWSNLELGKTRHTHCVYCEREVVINIKPLPNEISISGEAVAINCENETTLNLNKD